MKPLSLAPVLELDVRVVRRRLQAYRKSLPLAAAELYCHNDESDESGEDEDEDDLYSSGCSLDGDVNGDDDSELSVVYHYSDRLEHLQDFVE